MISKKRVVAPPRRDLSTRRMRRRRWPLTVLAILAIALLGMGFVLIETQALPLQERTPSDDLPSPSGHVMQNPSVTTCFTPAQACADLIVVILNNARSEIRLQAYGFTSLPILSALVSAKQRGVDVVVILDRSNDRVSTNRTASGAEYVARSGIPVFIDYKPAIAHNKIIVIDKKTVVTGSYNFTMAAERRNTENVTVVDSVEIAGQFLQNWESRRSVSRAFIANE